ncbi:MAG: ATP-binding protein [Nanoarchaeota archaeon]|nr:ATP-binding protein [Nanoarchaeota archaeon]
MAFLGEKLDRNNIIGNKLEVSLPLSSLLGLKLQGQLHRELMDSIYDLIELDNPMKDLQFNEEERQYLETMLTIDELPEILAINNLDELTLKDVKEKIIPEFNEKFNELRKEYRGLEKDTAKSLINKSLHFILTREKNEYTEKMIQAAENLPIPKESESLFYGNWFLIGDKIKKTINSKIESIEEIIKDDDKKLGELKQELRKQADNYITEIRTRMDKEEIKKLAFHSELGSKEENYILSLGNKLATEGSIIIPKIKSVTEHMGKDLTDLIKYQFPDKDIYCIEEASNSKDASAKYIKYIFFKNGLVMEDDGQAMDRAHFFEAYPFPYISIKKGKLNIGRFGAGSKAKLVEVMENKGEIFVESNPEGEDAMMNRYFMFNDELHIGFTLSDKKTPGLKISMLMPNLTKEGIANKKQLIKKKLKHFDPKKMDILLEKSKVNKDSLLRKENVQTIDYKGEPNRIYFNPEKKGEITFLSGEVDINHMKTPFELVMEIPLQFQPIEGRNDFVYTEELREYMANVFRKTILPRLKTGQKSLEWFVSNNLNQNPFQQFEQFATKDEMIDFYKLIFTDKDLTKDSKMVKITDGDAETLNRLVNHDIFIKGRNSEIDYMITLEEYAETTKTQDTDKTLFDIKKSMVMHETGLDYKEGKFHKKTRKITPIYVNDACFEEPFFYSRKNNCLLINTDHKAFSLEDKSKKDFYISQMLKVAANG